MLPVSASPLSTPSSPTDPLAPRGCLYPLRGTITWPRSWTGRWSCAEGIRGPIKQRQQGTSIMFLGLHTLAITIIKCWSNKCAPVKIQPQYRLLDLFFRMYRCDSYDPSNRVWERLSDLPLPVRSAAVVSRGKKMYIIGGWSTKPSDKVLVYLKVKEISPFLLFN